MLTPTLTRAWLTSGKEKNKTGKGWGSFDVKMASLNAAEKEAHRIIHDVGSPEAGAVLRCFT